MKPDTEPTVKGRGSKTPSVVFVNPCPDKLDAEKGQAMVGRHGRVIAQLCTEAGIPLSSVHVTNAVPVLPAKRQPSSDEVRQWQDHLFEELIALDPDVIITLGAPPLLSLYKNISIKEVAGFSLYNERLPNTPIIPTYAPGFLMSNSGKNWGMAAVVVAHLRKAQRIVDQEETRGFGSYTGVLNLPHLRALRDICLDTPFLSVDTETTGLSWMDDEILCVSFTPEEETGYSVPLLHRGTATRLKDKKLTKARANQLLRCTKEPPTSEEWAWLESFPWESKLEKKQVLN